MLSTSVKLGVDSTATNTTNTNEGNGPLFSFESPDASILADIFSTATTNTATSTSPGTTQTDPSLPPVDAFTQSTTTKDEQIQTNPIVEIDKDLENHPAATMMPAEKINFSTLSAFLSAVSPMVESGLVRNVGNIALRSWLAAANDRDEAALLKQSATTGYTLLHDLIIPESLKQEAQVDSQLHPEFLLPTCVSTNFTGSSVAVALGHPSHPQWCNHKGRLCIWNLNLLDIHSEKFFYTLEYSCCLTFVAYHPSIPWIIACGTFNGQVLVLRMDTDKEPLMYKCLPKNNIAHQESVCAMKWLASTNGNPNLKVQQEQLVTLAADGLLLVWEVNHATSTFTPFSGVQIFSGNLPVIEQAVCKKDTPLGTVCMSFAQSEVSQLTGQLKQPYPEIWVGTDPGIILRVEFPRALQSDALKLQMETGKMTVSNTVSPIRSDQQQHIGPVLSVATNPFSPDWHISCGSDERINLFHKNDLVMTWIPTSHKEMIHCLRWSPTNPGVFGASTSSGKILIYSLAENTQTPVDEFVPASPFIGFGQGGMTWSGTGGLQSSVQATAIISFVFHPSRPDQVTFVDMMGRTQVWKLKPLRKRGVQEAESALMTLRSARVV